MNNGVELLLERMKTHPEEFSGLGKDGSKWYPLITSYRQHLAEDDMKALDAGVDAIMQQQFTEKVLEGLVDPKPSRYGETLSSISPSSVTHLAGATHSPYTTPQMLHEQHMKEHLKALQREVISKKHETLYGRLKNYLHND